MTRQTLQTAGYMVGAVALMAGLSGCSLGTGYHSAYESSPGCATSPAKPCAALRAQYFAGHHLLDGPVAVQPSGYYVEEWHRVDRVVPVETYTVETVCCVQPEPTVFHPPETPYVERPPVVELPPEPPVYEPPAYVPPVYEPPVYVPPVIVPEPTPLPPVVTSPPVYEYPVPTMPPPPPLRK